MINKIILITTLIALLPQNVYEFKVKDIDGKDMDLSQHKGKKILIVNTASECGYTPQYKGLQELYEKYSDQLVVIGFPSNNFGGQEPGSNEEIKKFCSSKYEVTFPMASRVDVKGDNIHPLFKWLTTQENPDFTGSIKWNFEKFLIDETGKLIHRYRSVTKPMSDDILQAVKE